MAAVGHRELAADPPPPHRAGGIQIRPFTGYPGHPRPQHRDQGGNAPDSFGEKLADPGPLILLNVDQEHVGAVLADFQRERPQQVGLDRVDADDEEAAQSHRQQYDAGLIAGSRQIEDGVTHCEPRAGAQGLNQSD